MNLKPHFLPGAGRRSASVKVGVVHIVETVNGDNFNAALCGKKPTGKSLGWSETSRLPVDCVKCLEISNQNRSF